MKGYKLSLTAKTLTITKAFEEAWLDPESEEYKLYQRLMQEIPGLRVQRKTHATPKKYTTKKGEEFKHNPFKGLTEDNMEAFIEALSDHEAYEKQYKRAKEMAASFGMRPYTLARKWFLAQFPEYRKNPLVYLKKHPDVVDVKDIAASEQQKQDNHDNVVDYAPRSVKAATPEHKEAVGQ